MNSLPNILIPICRLAMTSLGDSSPSMTTGPRAVSEASTAATHAEECAEDGLVRLTNPDALISVQTDFPWPQNTQLLERGVTAQLLAAHGPLPVGADNLKPVGPPVAVRDGFFDGGEIFIPGVKGGQETFAQIQAWTGTTAFPLCFGWSEIFRLRPKCPEDAAETPVLTFGAFAIENTGFPLGVCAPPQMWILRESRLIEIGWSKGRLQASEKIGGPYRDVMDENRIPVESPFIRRKDDLPMFYRAVFVFSNDSFLPLN